MTEKILFVQLSDIHIRTSEDAVLKRAKAIAASTFPRLPEVLKVAILITGDIAFSGSASEYALAEKFINEIKSNIEAELKDRTVSVFVCPGNHDCNFKLDNDTRDAVLAKIRAEDGLPTTSLISTATAVQKEFFDFRDQISPQNWKVDTPLSWQSILRVGNRRIGIRSLNVAWMSKLKEKQGTLVFPPSVVVPFSSDDVDVSITLLHHPYNWFSQSSYRQLQTAVRSESQLVFTGHEHVQNIGEITDLRTPSSVFVEGGVLFENASPNHSTFNLLLVDLEKMEYLPLLVQWDGGRYDIADDSETWGSLRRLGVQSGSKCPLISDWQTTLNDPGANFTHSAKKNLDIDDFYVWPELQVTADTNAVKRNVIGSYLADVSNLNSGVMIGGEEKAGKTTLLYQYFKSYHERGYLPLYFRGPWFLKSHKNDPLRALKMALEKQYAKTCHSTFLQAESQKKILLLDDIDASSLPTSDLSECLEVFFRYFENVIVTTTDIATAASVLSTERIEALRNFTQYDLREFGYKKRFELVCKWAEIGGDNEANSARWMANIDKWEKDLTTAVGRQFVPAVPIFLLTLLQSIEAGRSTDLKNSAFGHYYHFLITSSLNEIGIDREQWAEVFNYCSTLAWYMYSTNNPHVLETYMRSFTDQYKTEYAAEVSYERRIKDLSKAGIITQRDGAICFKYPYLYFFFVGQYIGDRIHEIDMENEIGRLCSDMHLRENANILLFACHHTKSPVIYTRIAEALDHVFASFKCFDFIEDVEILNSLVNTAPSLIYNEQTVKESRLRDRERMDQEEPGMVTSDKNAEKFVKEANDAINRLFRSMEILGQFLKNHYGTTRNPIKDELIQKIFDGALRGLNGITHVLLSQANSLFDHIAEEAERKGESKDLQIASAKRLIFDITAAITFAFVHKASSAVGSSHLRDNLAKVVNDKNTLAYELIETSFELDLPDGLSIAKIKKLNTSVEKNVFAQALLRTLALKHLHLFKVPYQDKQKLCAELDIALTKQMALQRDQKRLQG